MDTLELSWGEKRNEVFLGKRREDYVKRRALEFGSEKKESSSGQDLDAEGRNG